MGFSPVKIESAVYDGRVQVTTKRDKCKGNIKSYLKDSDIKRAVDRLHIRKYPITDIEFSWFCRKISGELLEIENGSGPDITIEEAYKKETKHMGSPTKKVEFKLKDVKDGLDGVQVHRILIDRKEEIKKLANIGSSLRRIISALPEEGDDKKGEFKVVISFTKSFAEEDKFDNVICSVAEAMKTFVELGEKIRVAVEEKD